MDQSALTNAGLNVAPTWAILAGWLGRGLVVAALAAFLLSVVLGFFGRGRQAAVKAFFVVGVGCLFGTMLCLGALFVGDQFEYGYVAEHSGSSASALYKVAAIWAGQQGSFLLWACGSAFFGLLSYRWTGKYQRWFLTVFAAFLASLAAVLAFESPFGLLNGMILNGQVFVPAAGNGLVPSLQNYWVAIHPPTIFLGFGSLAVLFSYGASAMLTGDLESWVAKVRPWALVSLAILGLGVVMGGLWAYETQGWGGFWSWDPVENVSFVPWLLVVVFVHGLMVQAARKKWYATNALLAGLPFLLFVYGTFLTRSGYLDKFSVHSFAQMDRAALWILLALLVAVVLGYLGMWIRRGLPLASALATGEATSPSQRERAFAWGAILLSGLAISIAFGMSVPFFFGLLGKDGKVVEEPLYHQVVVWFYVPIMLLLAITPFLSWRSHSRKEGLTRLWYVLGLAVLVESLVIFVLDRSDWKQNVDPAAAIQFPFGGSVPRVPWVLFLFFVTSVAVSANAWRIGELVRRSRLGIGGFVAHMGLALTLAGLILSRGLEQKEQILVMDGTPGEGLGYDVRYDRMTADPSADNSNKAVFVVTPVSGGKPFEVRSTYFQMQGDDGRPSAFTSPAIVHGWNHDLYVSLGVPQTDLWDQPEHFDIGETKAGTGISITYLGLAVHGQPGQPSATFGAKLRVVEDGRTYYAEPRIGMQGSDSPQASPSLRARITGMDASDGSISLQMPYTHIMFPLELYYKPFTGLVWLGAGLITLGGLIAARYRWAPQAASDASVRAAPPAAVRVKASPGGSLAPQRSARHP